MNISNNDIQWFKGSLFTYSKWVTMFIDKQFSAFNSFSLELMLFRSCARNIKASWLSIIDTVGVILFDLVIKMEKQIRLSTTNQKNLTQFSQWAFLLWMFTGKLLNRSHADCGKRYKIKIGVFLRFSCFFKASSIRF